MPSKKQVLVGLAISMAALFIYNKVPAVRRVLGGA
jgi:hypothetical protein